LVPNPDLTVSLGVNYNENTKFLTKITGLPP